jgi:hypothetical protein
MLTLFLAPGSSSMAPHIALHEVGAPFQARPLSFARQENRDPAYLAINPEGKVPTLLVEGRPLTEVAGILFYLARRFPGAGSRCPSCGEDRCCRPITMSGTPCQVGRCTWTVTVKWPTGRTIPTLAAAWSCNGTRSSG